MARVLTASMGLVIVAVTIWLHHLSKETNIIDLCQRGFNCFLGPLGGLFVLGMFSRRATPGTVIPAILVGEAVGIGGSYSKDLFGVQFSTHLVVPASWLATVVVSLCLSLFVWCIDYVASAVPWSRRGIGLVKRMLPTFLATPGNSKSLRWMWKPVVSGETTPPEK